MTYLPKLDGLRCIAILMVLLGHFMYFLGGTNPGIYGVNLFFVLSGFLITTILLKENGQPPGSAYKRFLGRRALRIFPIYYLALTFYFSLSMGDINKDWPFLYSYTYNFHVSGSVGWVKNVYAPYWSLSVEEQFYVFFPFVVLLLNKRPNWQLTVFICITAVAIFERVFLLTGVHPYINLLTNMFALGTGAIGAWLRHHRKLSKTFFHSKWIEIAVIACLVLVFNRGESLYGFLFYPLLNVFFVLKAADYSFRIVAIDIFLRHEWSCFIGKISYGMYLYHILVLHFFNEYLFNPVWNLLPFEAMGVFSKLQYNATLIKFPFVVILTIGVAFFSYRYIESPVLRLKNRFFAIA